MTDPDYTGSVTLAFQNNPGSAKFVVGGNPVTTMTASAVNGVADFSPITVNTAGFGYTLVATATSLTSVVSSSFNVVARERNWLSSRNSSNAWVSASSGSMSARM